MRIYTLKDLDRWSYSGCEFFYIYVIIKHKIQNCLNPNNPKYNRYGGRGITIYQEWINNRKLFGLYVLNTIGPRPSKDHSLDRIDNDKGLEPGNIKWSTKVEQQNNRSDWKETNTGEKYISIKKNGHISVMINNKKYGYFASLANSLEEAIRLRDNFLNRL